MESGARDKPSKYWPAAAAVTLLLFIDGFDLFLLGKIAPAIAAGFGHRPSDMSVVFTWNQVGLAVGAFLMPMLADRYGLRRLLIIMMFFLSVGTLATSFATSLFTFAVLRGITGLFLAGALPVALALLSEIVPKAKLGTILSVAMVGMSAGAAANSVAAAWLLDLYGWQSGLWLGALLPALALPLVMILLSEPQRFTKGVASPVAGKAITTNQLGGLFADRRAAMTLLLWLLCFLTLGHTALIASWLPTFFQVLGGIEIQRFALVSMLTVIGGAVGTLAIGWLQDHSNPLALTALACLGNGLGLVMLGYLGFGSVTFAIMFLIWSLLQSASITGLNLLLVRAYPIDVRSTGKGWAAGFGRIGGIGAPIAGSLILTANVPLTGALWLASLPMILIAAVVMPVLAYAMRPAPIEPRQEEHVAT
jgi:AAHS family 4-hydroxybenzoate transporter-like MFS transporter